MDHLRFAVCIVFPETTAIDLVNAAVRHNVHIIDKEPFDPDKDYSCYQPRYILENGVQLYPLFVFPTDTVFAEDDASFQEALDRLGAFRLV